MKKIFVLAAVVFSVGLGAEVFRIEFETDYNSMSKKDLRRRVWNLERAVAQLQDRVFELSHKKSSTIIVKRGKRSKKSTCYVSSFGDTFTSTKSTETAAKADVLAKCSKENHAMHCKNITCGK